MFWLCVIDILTKWYSVVKVEYGRFGFRNFFRAWKEKKLNSSSIKRGTGVKVICYTPVLYIAHQCSLVAEMFGGGFISSTMYSIVIIVECISVLENLADCGLTAIKPVLKMFRKKEKEITGDLSDESEKTDENN